MKLYIMRHGPAEEQADSGADADRALTATGRERVRQVAKALADAEEEPAHIMTSPLVRAVQTAEIVALVTRLADRDGTVSVRRAIAPGGSASVFARRLASEGARRTMFVGHEPDLSGLVSALIGVPWKSSFDKAMVVGLDLTTSGEGRLRFVLHPKTLQITTD